MYAVTAIDDTYLEITRVFAVKCEAEVYSNYLWNSRIGNKVMSLNKVPEPNYLLLTFDQDGKTLQGRLFSSEQEAEPYLKKYSGSRLIILNKVC